MTYSNWILENNRAIHLPCNSYGYINDDNKIVCSICKTQLPEELEIPAMVFGAYKHSFSRSRIMFDSNNFYILLNK